MVNNDKGNGSRGFSRSSTNTIFLNRFFHPDLSATSQFLSDVAFALAESDIPVTVLTSGQLYDEPDKALVEKEVVAGVSVERLRTTRFGRLSAPGRLVDYLSFIWAARRRLAELVDAETIVVAKTDPPLLGLFLDGTVRRRGGRMVNWLQDLFPEVLTRLTDGRVLRWLMEPLRRARNRSLRRSDMNVVIGRGMGQYLSEAGVPGSRIRVIENWAHDEQSAGQEALPEDWCPPGRFVVGYFGNLGRAHEYDTVLGAMRRLADRSDIVFLFVGGGVLLAKLSEVARREGLTNFQRRQYVPRSMLHAALQVPAVHLVILRPELEGLVVPSKFAGVAAAGRPVIYIGSGEGDIGGMVRESGCGHVVPAGNSSELAARIEGLAGDSEAVARLGERARGVYEARYRSEAAFEKWRKVLEAVRGDDDGPAC